MARDDELPVEVMFRAARSLRLGPWFDGDLSWLRWFDWAVTERVSPIAHSKFRAAVQQFKREGVLSGLGVLTARARAEHRGVANSKVTPLPWQAGLVAREALLASSNRRAGVRTPSAQDLMRLCVDSDLIDQHIFHNGDLQTWGLQTAFLQFPYSQSDLGSIARTRLMFDRDLPASRFEVLSAETLIQVLGAPVDVFIDSAPFFSAATASNGGRFDRSWLSGPQFDEVRALIDLDDLVSVFDHAWSASLTELREQARKSTSANPLDRAFDFNPLLARPFVKLTTGGFVAPNAWWASSRVSPTAIYHLGMRTFEEAWARDLGLAQEDYILEQLGQLKPTARVVPEFEYATRHGAMKSVDAFIFYEDLAVLVESKSLRARLDSTSGVDAYRARLGRDLDKVYRKQLPRSVELIRSGHPALGPVRPDIPVVALVVTPEPLYLVNNSIYGSALPPAKVPTVIVSLSELENLVAGALVRHSGEVFTAAAAPTSNRRVDPSQALRDLFPAGPPENPLIADAFDRGRW